MAGLEPGEFSAHGLRSGYLTEAANRGIPLPRGDGAITPPIRSAGIELLQQRDPPQRSGSATSVILAKRWPVDHGAGQPQNYSALLMQRKEL
jgi:hypothetical protein